MEILKVDTGHPTPQAHKLKHCMPQKNGSPGYCALLLEEMWA